MLVVIDTLRADDLGCYGSTASTSPALDRLASSGAIFDDLFAASPWTTTSMASIITGKYPDELGVRTLRDALPPPAHTVAERLREAGYHTGAVISNALCGPPYGFDQGYEHLRFERYRGEPGIARTSIRPVFTADRVTDRAIELLPKLEPPFFLYVHYTDPHEPYLPPESWVRKFLGDRPPLEDTLLLSPAYLRIDDEQLSRARAHYRAAIAFTDHELDRLLSRLPADAFVIVTADHGEEFRDHGGLLHGHTLFQELLHVPLIVKGPGIGAGSHVKAPVCHADLTPTILDLAGAPADASLSGSSLRRAMTGGESAAPERTLFSIRESPAGQYLAVRRGRWKLHCRPDRRVALFDLEADPLERNDLAAARRDEVASLLADLDARRVHPSAAPVTTSPETDEERLKELRAIGYVK